jgi:hypothetical protein
VLSGPVRVDRDTEAARPIREPAISPPTNCSPNRRVSHLFGRD